MRSLSHEVATPKDPCSRNRNGISRFFVLAFAALILATPAYAQFDSGESQPPPPPKPRFPQLPDDPVVPPPGDPKTSPAVVDRKTELVGDIQKIENRKITLKHNKSEETYTVNVAPKATILLNKKPATLEDLMVEDFVRISLTQTAPDAIANRIVAARVIADTPPQPKPMPRPIRRPITQSPPTRPVDKGAGLGVTVSDSPDLGIVVLNVHQDTPAWASGLRTGDYLLKLNTQNLETPSDFMGELGRHNPKDSVRLVIWRNGKMKEGDVNLTTAQVAKDRVVGDDRAMIPEESNGLERSSVFIDREPEQSTVVVVKEPAEKGVAIDRDPAEEVVIPKDYGTLEKDYRRLLDRVSQLEQELNRLKKQ